MGLFGWLSWRRLMRQRAERAACQSQTSEDTARELDQRQHDVARRLHILEYETSEAVQAMRRRKQDDAKGQNP